ncbi:MAG: hypothetical protein L0Z62_15890 [Gemmataceae bacterium]|nr:hypothetical protein [Gemmataceae bacterium]
MGLQDWFFGAKKPPAKSGGGLTIEIPAEIIRALDSLGQTYALSEVVTRALKSILEGTSQDRMTLMQFAQELMGGPMVALPAVPVDDNLVADFHSLCTSKMLRPEVLLTGALMAEVSAIYEATAGPAEIERQAQLQRVVQEQFERRPFSPGDALVTVELFDGKEPPRGVEPPSGVASGYRFKQRWIRKGERWEGRWLYAGGPYDSGRVRVVQGRKGDASISPFNPL